MSCDLLLTSENRECVGKLLKYYFKILWKLSDQMGLFYENVWESLTYRKNARLVKVTTKMCDASWSPMTVKTDQLTNWLTNADQRLTFMSVGGVCRLECVCGGVPSAQALVLSCGIAGAHGEVYAGAAAARFTLWSSSPEPKLRWTTAGRGSRQHLQPAGHYYFSTFHFS